MPFGHYERLYFRVLLPFHMGGVEALVRKQLEIMEKQLEMLRNPVHSKSGSSRFRRPPCTHCNRRVSTSHHKHSTAAAARACSPALPAQASRNPRCQAFGPYKPVQKGVAGALPDQQQKALDALIARYTTRTKKSKRLTAEHRAHFADPRTVSGFRQIFKEMVYPIVTERSQGSRLWDVDGNEYVDMTNGFGSILFGHRPDFVIRALSEQMDEGL